MTELSVEGLSKMLKQQLVDACKERGLDTSGKKDDLVARLKEHLESNGGEADNAPAADEDAPAEEETKEEAQPETEEPETKADADKTGTEALLTEEEKRLADRAKRFGVTVDTTLEAKRKARAMRFAGSLDDVAKVLKGEKTGAGNKGAKKGEPVVSEEELERMKKRAEKFGKKTSDVLVTEEQRKMKEEMSKAIEERAKRFKST